MSSSLTEKQKKFVAAVKSGVGRIAAASVECILTGQTTNFQGLTVVEESCVRDLARQHDVSLAV